MGAEGQRHRVPMQVPHVPPPPGVVHPSRGFAMEEEGDPSGTDLLHGAEEGPPRDAAPNVRPLSPIAPGGGVGLTPSRQESHLTGG